MTDETQPKNEMSKRRALLLDRRFWSLVVALAIAVLYLRDHRAFLDSEQKASFDAANYIEHNLTPGAFKAAFHARAAQCEYHWLFACYTPTPATCFTRIGFTMPSCPLGDGNDKYSFLDPDRYRPGPMDFSLFGAVFSGVLTLSQLLDETWYVLETKYYEGWLTFALLLAFLGVNLFVATRAPLMALPLVFPICVTISSWLFYVVQQIFALGAGTAGAVFYCLLAVAGLPLAIVKLLGWIVGEHEIRGFIHGVKEGGELVREALPHQHGPA